MVLAKVGASFEAAMAATSSRWRFIPSWKAGRKCSSLILSKGGTPKGVCHSSSSGLGAGVSAARAASGRSRSTAMRAWRMGSSPGRGRPGRAGGRADSRPWGPRPSRRGSKGLEPRVRLQAGPRQRFWRASQAPAVSLTSGSSFFRASWGLRAANSRSAAPSKPFTAASRSVASTAMRSSCERVGRPS